MFGVSFLSLRSSNVYILRKLPSEESHMKADDNVLQLSTNPTRE